MRLDAFTEFRGLATPTINDEDWRFTDLSSIYKKTIFAAKKIKMTIELLGVFFSRRYSYRLVFINGVFCKDSSIVTDKTEATYIGTLQDSLNCVMGS